MPSVAYDQGRRAFNQGTGMKNPYTHLIKNRFDKKDSLTQALIRSETDWARGNDDARRENERRLKQYRDQRNGTA